MVRLPPKNHPFDHSLSIVLLTALTLFSCKEQSLSSIKTNLSRPDLVGVVDCNRNTFGSERPLTRKYLYNLLNFIIKSNSETFKGDLRAEKFCIGSQMNELNAFAFAYDRSINFGRDLIMLAQYDSEIAAVLSHELAHIVLRHSMGGSQNSADTMGIAERDRAMLKLRAETGPIRSAYLSARSEAVRRLASVLECAAKSDSKVAAEMDYFSSIGTKDKVLEKPASTPILEDDLSFVPALDIELKDATGIKQKTLDRTLAYFPRFTLFSKQKAAGETFDESSYPDFANYSRFRALAVSVNKTPCGAEKFKSIHKEMLKQEIPFQKINTTRLNLMEQIKVLKTAGMNSDSAENWQESEADDTGFKMFTATSLNDYGFNWIFAESAREKMGIEEPKNAAEHKAMIDKVNRECSTNEDSVKRGYRQHPSACWRVINILRDQKTRANLARRSKAETLPSTYKISTSPTLEQVKAELLRTHN